MATHEIRSQLELGPDTSPLLPGLAIPLAEVWNS